MGEFRFEPNRRAISSLLTTPETRALIERKTRAAENAAASGGGQFRIDVETGPQRVRGAVIGDYDATDPADSRRALLDGLDAARGED